MKIVYRTNDTLNAQLSTTEQIEYNLKNLCWKIFDVF